MVPYLSLIVLIREAKVSGTRLVMTVLVLTLDRASGHSFRTHFWEAIQANVVLSSCLHPSVLLIRLSVRPCGELDSETQLTTNPVEELKD